MEDCNQFRDDHNYNHGADINEQITNIATKMAPTYDCPQCYADNLDILKGLIELVEIPEKAKQEYKVFLNSKFHIIDELDVSDDLIKNPHVNPREFAMLLAFVALVYGLPDAGVLPADLSSGIIDVCVHKDDTNI